MLCCCDTVNSKASKTVSNMLTIVWSSLEKMKGRKGQNKNYCKPVCDESEYTRQEGGIDLKTNNHLMLIWFYKIKIIMKINFEQNVCTEVKRTAQLLWSSKLTCDTDAPQPAPQLFPSGFSNGKTLSSQT